MALVRYISILYAPVLSVKARSLLCYWGARELGMITVALAGQLHLAQPAISQSALRGRKIALAEKLKLL